MFVNGMLYNRYTLLVLYITIHFKKTLMWNVPRNKITKSAVRAKKVEVIMIEQSDIEIVDKEYFETIEIKEYTIVIRSLSTGHYWCLLEQIYNGCRTFQILHKHKEAEPYHPQKNRPSVLACCDYIKSHDAYQLRKEREKEESRQRRKEKKRKKRALPG